MTTLVKMTSDVHLFFNIWFSILTSLFLSYFFTYGKLLENQCSSWSWSKLYKEKKGLLAGHCMPYIIINFVCLLTYSGIDNPRYSFYAFIGLFTPLVLMLSNHFFTKGKDDKNSWVANIFSLNYYKEKLLKYRTHMKVLLEKQELVKEISKLKMEKELLEFKNKRLEEQNKKIIDESNFEKVFSFKRKEIE